MNEQRVTFGRFSRLAISGVAGWVTIHWFGSGLFALFVVMALAFMETRRCPRDPGDGAQLESEVVPQRTSN